MKRLLLFLLGAYVFHLAAFAAADPETFFGGRETKAPRPLRPDVERALAALDAAMVRFYETGDEGPARAALVDPDAAASPLVEWRKDRAAYLAHGAAPRLVLEERRLDSLPLTGGDHAFCTARERWTVAGSERAALEVTVRYRFAARGPQLAVAGAEVLP